jgi:putative ABC transport system permease protein
VTVSLVGPDPGSRLLTLPLVAGRWLKPDDVDGVVINNAVVANHPGLGVGDRVGVRANGRTTTFPVVGIVRELAPMPVIYAPPGAVRGVTGRTAGAARSIRVVTQGHDDDAQRAAGRAIEAALGREGITVSGMHRMLDMKQSILDHLVIILSILTMASIIVVIVGAIGLASTLTVSVVQRTREIGILGAIGATPRTIAGQVAVEGVLLGLFSWLVALLLSIPLSYGLETTCGRIFLKTPLDFHLSPGGAATWLGLVLVLSLICSFDPARRATRLSVREALGVS